MSRVKRGVTKHARHQKILKAAKANKPKIARESCIFFSPNIKLVIIKTNTKIVKSSNKFLGIFEIKSEFPSI